MAVQIGDTSENNNQQQQVPVQGQAQAQPAEQPATPVTPRSFAIGNLNSALFRPLGRTDAGALLADVSSKMKALFEDDKYNSPTSEPKLRDFRIVPIDHKLHRTTLSLLMVVYPLAVTTKDGQRNVLVSHGLILEGSDAPLAPTTDEWNGRRYEITKVPGDIIFDQKSLLTRVEELVRAAVPLTGNDPVDYVNAGFQVLPTEVNLEDHDQLRALAFYATNACVSTAAERFGLQDPVTLAGLESNVELEISPDYSPEKATTVAGLPRRTDARLGVSANIRDADGNHRQPLTDVAAQISLIYTPPVVNTGFGSFDPKNSQLTDKRCFTALIEVTRLDTRASAITLELQNLGILSTSVLTGNLEWLNPFRVNRHLDAKDDMRDVGALALVYGPEKMPTRSANFDENAWLHYMGTLCHENAAIALRVEDAGELTWMNSVYVAAANGDIEAARLIHKAFDNLTGNNFSRHYPANDDNLKAMFASNGERLFDGYFIDRNGEKQDLAEVDFLYNLNSTGDFQQAAMYQDTFDDTTLPMDVRLEQRQRILESMLGAQNVKIKGFSTRVYVNPAVVAAGAQALRDLNISITRSRNSYAHGATRLRGNHTMASYAAANLGGDLFNNRRAPVISTLGNTRMSGGGAIGRW